MRSGCAAVLALVACALMESRASAEAIERIAVSYEAHSLCPNEEAFVGEIAARTSKFRRVSPSEAARLMRVKLSEEPGHAMTRGELVVTEGDAESVRVVHDENCAVVVSGLALIAALAIDPEAETGPVDRLAAPAPTPPPPTSVVAPTPEPERPAPMVVAKPSRAIAIGAAAGAGARVGLVPASAIVTIAGILGIESPSLLRPQARIELSASAPRTVSAGGPAAELQWFGGHVEGCGLLGLSRAARFRAGPCALFEVGAVHASGVSVRDAVSTTRAGASVGAGLRAMLTSGRFYGDLGAFALVPFRRDRFYVDPSVTLFQSTAVGAEVGANVGVIF